MREVLQLLQTQSTQLQTQSTQLEALQRRQDTGRSSTRAFLAEVESSAQHSLSIKLNEADQQHYQNYDVKKQTMAHINEQSHYLTISKIAQRITDDLPGDADPALNVERSRELFDAALARTVEEILASGKRVVLLSQAPTTGVDLSQCLALFPWAEAARQGSARCAGLTSADARTRSDFADRELAEYAGREDVLVVRPIDFFCGGETCLWADPETGDFMYRDSNHLNPAGSLFLMDGAERESGLVEFLREARAVRDARG